MANVIVNLPAPAGNGSGASQSTASLGKRRTITVQDPFQGTVNIEGSADAGTTWATVCSFSAPGEQVVDVAVNAMRVTRVGVPEIAPGLPNVDVGAESLTGDYTALPVTAGNGFGAAVDVLAYGGFKTVTVTGAYNGTVLIQGSEDGNDYATFFAFTPGGASLQSRSFVAAFMRAQRAGVPEVAPGLPVVNLGAVEDGGGGGGGSSVTVVEVEGGDTETLPDGTTLDAGAIYVYKNIGENTDTITINAFAGQTIDGEADFEMSGAFIAGMFSWDGVSNWRAI